MKHLKQYVLLFIAFLLCLGCQKVIQVKVSDEGEQIVIEGNVSDDSLSPHVVKITRSLGLESDASFPSVSGASVVISDNLGNSVSLKEVEPGIYQNSTLIAYSGRTYFLNVVVNGKEYKSSCTMPQRVSLDSILISESSGFGGAELITTATPVYTDPLGRGNYYKFVLQKNASVSNSLFLFDDQIIDGAVNTRPLQDMNFVLNKNDTVRISMMCINKTVHHYFYSLSQNGNGPAASASPANPSTNVEGATLGYFSAHTLQTKSVKIK